MESMDDYKEELEASLKKIRVGDVVTGTVIDVTDDAVIVDLKAYADGVIRKDDLSEDPDFNMAEMIHPGDEITATESVLRTCPSAERQRRMSTVSSCASRI